MKKIRTTGLFAAFLLLPLAVQGQVIVAHRGGASIGNENTLSCFEKGIAAGADMIELDVHLTADGEVVVCHDPDLKRTTDVQGAIEKMTLEEFKRARALDRETGEPTGEALPTLAEVFGKVGDRCGILLEIKKFHKGQYEGIEQKCLDLIGQYGLHDRVVMQSFDDSVVEKIHSLDPTMRVEKLIFCRLPFGLCFDGGIRRFSFKKYDYCTGINPMGKLIGRRFVRDAHAAGKTVRIWTVNDPKKVIEGVNGIITNRPDLFARKRPVRFFSHRGGRMEYDENTLSAFEASYLAGYRGFETDVRMTLDGELVILHDSNLARTTDTEGAVEEMTAAQIRQARTRQGHSVLFLDELMDWLDSKGDVTYVEFELKSNPVELYPEDRLQEYCEKLYERVLRNKPEDATYLFTSSDYRGLRYLQAAHPGVRMLMITGKPCNEETIALCRSLGIDRLGATMNGTSRAAVREAHRQGLTVSLWPGQSVADAMLGVYLEADFLCTDIPVEVKTFMDRQAPWIPAVY